MRLAIQVVLALVIVVLAYLLYQAIQQPWDDYEERIELEELGRERMDDVRNALISFRDANEAYPPSLDSLVNFVKNDTAFVMLELPEGEERYRPFMADSIPYSARGGARFNYELVTTDTSRVEVYWLQDPGVPGDSIGSRVRPPNPAFRNAASWLE